ncbi:lipolytic protein G-D-S-L family [Fischerella thermalis CCMEE 5198]|jgi:lysophospholipase L1-like esterase|uniref:GDSL-type esterase/lipase family protein n=1 Tax=Fischerella thermalis TaxID=372787 RepID=UPI000C800491|nr:GDSL-type esterase/lipase family protein [Fischerella thermalis]PMB25050.1 lipolytic protein G-D-S-L family [Fischerella thermalis CCMEE 5198]PMB47429.1 lipolytic protein G-D-S-L family [Fischerella thermalis CCMEE 5201]
MRDVYLLAAGLLTGLVLPASTLPQQPIFHTDDHQVHGKNKENLQPVVTETLIPTLETSSPEFSEQSLPVATESFLTPSYKPIWKPTSGNELYYHRLAALKAGQIYTRIADEELKTLWDSNNHQLTYEDWKSLLAMEAKAMAKGQGKNRLSILVGDSLSMWFPKEMLKREQLWLNQGISGDTSSGVLKRLSAFARTKPSVIYVMVGINDLRKGRSDEVILSNHRLIIRRLRQNHPESMIIVQSILPSRLSNISNNRIRTLNHQLALIAQKEGVNYLNLYNWFADFEGNLREDLTTDGLHLSEYGYEVWRAAIDRIESQLAFGS